MQIKETAMVRVKSTFLPKDHGYRYRHLQHYHRMSYNISSRYKMSNCLFEASFENILKTCECASAFHTMGGVEAMENFEVCSGQKLTSMNELLNRMGKSDFVSLNVFTSIFRRV
jgi:hypothetical protein